MAKQNEVNRKPYTKAEIKKIKETSFVRLKDLAFAMNRSYASLRRKKWRLENLEKDREIQNNHKKKINKELREKSDRYLIWSKAEEEFILTSTLPDVEIARTLKRTVGSVQTKRNRLLKGTKNESKKGKSRTAEQV